MDLPGLQSAMCSTSRHFKFRFLGTCVPIRNGLIEHDAPPFHGLNVDGMAYGLIQVSAIARRNWNWFGPRTLIPL